MLPPPPHTHPCLSLNWKVYTWGSNSVGQLGLGDQIDRHSPTLMDALWGLPVVQLAAGESHSLALTTSGHMFAWGSNHYGQLGLLPDAENASGAEVVLGKAAVAVLLAAAGSRSDASRRAAKDRWDAPGVSDRYDGGGI